MKTVTLVQFPTPYYLLPSDLRSRLDAELDMLKIGEQAGGRAIEDFRDALAKIDTSGFGRGSQIDMAEGPIGLEIQIYYNGSSKLSAAKTQLLEKYKAQVNELFSSVFGPAYQREIETVLGSHKGRRYPKLKVPIGSIDKEIRSHILALNQLPFIDKTMYSCSGHGRDDDGGHVMLIYKSEDGRVFHDALVGISRSVKHTVNVGNSDARLVEMRDFSVGIPITYYFNRAEDWDAVMEHIRLSASKPSRQHGRRRYSATSSE